MIAMKIEGIDFESLQDLSEFEKIEADSEGYLTESDYCTIRFPRCQIVDNKTFKEFVLSDSDIFELEKEAFSKQLGLKVQYDYGSHKFPSGKQIDEYTISFIVPLSELKKTCNLISSWLPNDYNVFLENTSHNLSFKGKIIESLKDFGKGYYAD